MDEHVEDVGHVDEPRLERDRLPLQAVRVARAVPALVMGAGDPLRDAEHLGVAVGQHAGAEHGVGLDHLELLVGELAGLEQDGVGDRDLAQVVQRRRVADEPDEPVVPRDVARHPRRERGDALRVLGRVVVAVLRRQREPAQRVDADGLRVAERTQRLAGHDRLELAEPPAHRPVLEAQGEPPHAGLVEAPARVGQLVDRHHRRARVQAQRVELHAHGVGRGPGQRDDHLRLGGGRLDRDEVEHGDEVHRGAPRGAELRAQTFGRLARAPDDKDPSARERAVIHTAT